ncbi:IS200/IS605 family accessory protein TnpB-related protein, partial [Aquifex sp.]
RLKVKGKEKEMLDGLMRRWSSCMRYAYKRLLEGKTRNELKKELQNIFNLNSRYVDDAILEAQKIIASAKELGFNPKKVVFGGRKFFEKLSKKHLSEKQRNRLKREWKEKRQGNLYSRGDKSKKGNLNLRVIMQEGKPYLRINVGNRKWIILELITSHKKWGLFESYLTEGVPYSVRIQKRNGRYYCYITFEEELPPIGIGLENGAIGIDLNAFPSHIAWAEVGKDGNLRSYGEVHTPHLFDGKKTKRDYWAWIYAHEVVRIALEKRRGIVLENLKIKEKGFRGDYTGRKSRRIRHNFSYRKLKERIVHLARRYGIAVKEVNPAYTSVIGMLKYAPQLSLTKDVASAWVIARRGLGLSERIPKNYRVLIGSPQRESGRADGSTDGRNPSAPKFPKGASYNPWRVLRVAVLTALSPERSPRCLSPLKRLLISGDVGRIQVRGREFPLLGTGTMGVQMPPAGFMDTLKRRGINSPAPNCIFVRFG